MVKYGSLVSGWVFNSSVNFHWTLWKACLVLTMPILRTKIVRLTIGVTFRVLVRRVRLYCARILKIGPGVEYARHEARGIEATWRAVYTSRDPFTSHCLFINKTLCVNWQCDPCACIASFCNSLITSRGNWFHRLISTLLSGQHKTDNFRLYIPRNNTMGRGAARLPGSRSVSSVRPHTCTHLVMNLLEFVVMI